MALSSRDQARLERFLRSAGEFNRDCLGYPSGKQFDFSALSEFLRIPLNNIGDPFGGSSYRVSSHGFERDVLKFMADVLRAPQDEWWGYVTNGGTEGNLYGLYLARELYPAGIVYFSQDTHYSVSKNVHFLNMRHIMIRSQSSGEMDYEDLRETLRIHRDVPAIIFANIGTTMTEAKDDLAVIREILTELAISQHYIHCDAALCGMYLPFAKPRLPFDFVDGAHSIAISGHKFLGSPIPSGIVLALRDGVDRIARSVAYIGSMDTTITGSRNGLTPLMLWYSIRSLGRRGIAAMAKRSIAEADYVERSLKEMGIDAWRNPNAITVVFPRPSDRVVRRWQLASSGEISHILTMPGTARDEIDAFLDDMRRE